jgi:AraC family transcriptional regulator, transcriptional activator of the genes for pyochelin and ferripyochelin receptors
LIAKAAAYLVLPETSLTAVTFDTIASVTALNSEAHAAEEGEMTERAPKMLAASENVQEFSQELGELLSPVERDMREAAFVKDGPLLNGKFEVFSPRPGLRLVASDMDVRRDSKLNIEPACPGVAFWLVLGGRCACTVRQPSGRDESYEFLPGRSVIAAFQPCTASWTVSGGNSHRFVELQMDSATASQLISENYDLGPSPLRSLLARPDGASEHIYRALTPELTVIAHQILNCPFEGPAKKLFMESKALEILALQLDMLSSSDPRETAAPNKGERERLEEARRILDEEYSDPPSLLTLARRVGLNDFKLKRGFRTHFETTVFGYVRRVRMEKALAMLQIGALNVSEVATAAGYTCFGHFSIAFRKRFGIAPSDVKRARTVR